MQDTKIKAAKEFYESVGMTTEQIKDTIKTLGFVFSFDTQYWRTPYAINIDECFTPKYQVVVTCRNIASDTQKTLLNPRYANQIQQLIKDTNENII